MKKIVLASVAATALIASLAPVKAEEPGEQQLISQRGALQGNQIGATGYGSAPWTASDFGGSPAAAQSANSEFFVSERYGPLGYVPVAGPALGGIFEGFED
jgi:hypothetical protein